MSHKVDLVKKLMLLPKETRKVEFKRAEFQYSYDKTLDYCAALANEGGGYLVLGVTDSPPRGALGTQAFRNPQDIEQKLHEKLNLRVEIDELQVDGNRVVLIEVGGRPRGSAVMINGRYLMRQGESLVDMTPDHLRTIFAEVDTPFLDGSVAKNLSVSQVDDAIDMECYFRLSNTLLPHDAAQRCHALAANGILTDEGGTYGITGLGAALFARHMSDFLNLRDRRLRFLWYSGTSRTSVRRDYIAEGGYALEFKPFLETVQSCIPLDERIKAAHREMVPMYHETALRELLANAIAHQDFRSLPSLLAVELYEDRLEITNPGEPLLDTRRFAEYTKPRNLQLSLMMRELKMCEARGSGIQRTLEQNESIGAADPRFQAGDGLTKAILIGKHDFMTMSSSERHWAIFMHACRMWAGHQPMTNASFRKRYGLPDKRSALVSTHFQSTIEEGLIRPQDAESSSRRYARYVPFYATV